MTDFPRGLTETVTKNDSLILLYTFMRVLLETGGFTLSGFSLTGFTSLQTDVSDKTNKGTKDTIADSLGIPSDISSSIKNVLGNLRFVANTIGQGDLLGKIGQFFRSHLSSKGVTVTGFTLSGFTLDTIISTSDVIEKGEIKNIVESFGTFGTALANININGNLRFIENSIPNNDSVDRVLEQFRSMFQSGGFTLSGFKVSGFEVGADGSNSLDIINKGLGYFMTESTSLSDLVAEIKNELGNLRFFVEGAISLTQGIQKDVTKTLMESRGFTLSGFSHGFTQGGVIISDVANQIKNQFRTITDTPSIALLDNLNLTIKGAVRLSTESIALTQSIRKDISKILLEVSGFTFTGFTPTGFVLNTGWISDSVGRIQNTLIPITDEATVILSDAVVEIKNELGNLRFISDTIILSQSIQKDVSKFIVETFGFVLSGFTTSGFTLTSGVPILDSISLTKVNLFRTIMEFSGFTLSGFTISGFSFNGGVFVNDVISKNVSKFVAETIVRNDTIKKALSYTIAELTTLNDSVIRRNFLDRVVAWSKGFTDTGFTVSGFSLQGFSFGTFIGDLLDVSKHTGNLFRNIVETSGFSVTGFTASGFFIGSGVFISDVIRKDITKLISNSITSNDVANITRIEYFTELFETITTNDSVLSVMALIRSIVEQSGFTRTGFTLSGFTLDNGIYLSDVDVAMKRVTQLFRTINEVSGFTTSGFSITGFVFNGGVGLFDSISKDIVKIPMLESISFGGDITVGLKGAVASFIETVTQGDLLVSTKGLVRDMLAGGFTRTGFTLSGFVVDSSVLSFDLVEGVVRIANFFRTINEIGGFTKTGFELSGFLTGGVQMVDSVVFVKEILAPITEPAITFGADITTRIINELGNLRFVSESIALTQGIRKDVSKILQELGGFTPTGFTFTGFITPSIPVSDIVQGIQDIPRLATEIITHGDLVERVTWNFRVVRGVLTSIPLSDSIFKGVGFGIVENITVSDAVTKLSDLFRIDLNEIVTQSEVIINGVKNIVSITAVDINLSDVISKGVSYAVDVETIILSDVVDRVRNLGGQFRSALESITLSQSITKDILKNIIETSGFTFSGFTPTGFFLQGGVTVLDIIQRGFNTNVIETITLSDGVVEVKNILGNVRFVIEDSIALTQSIQKDITKIILQIPAFTQSGFTESGFLRNSGVLISDVVAIIENVDLFREISESSGFTITGFTDAFYKNGGVFVSDTINRFAELTRLNTDTLISSDGLKSTLSFILAETIPVIPESVLRTIGFVRAILEQEGFSFSGFTGTGFVQDVAVNITDSIARVASGEFFANISESAGFSISGFTPEGFYINGGVFIGDVVERMAVLTRGMTNDVITLSDVSNRIQASIGTLSETITTNDSVVDVLAFFRNIIEESGFTFSGFTPSGFTINNGINVTDFITQEASLTNFFRVCLEGAEAFTLSGFTLSGFVVKGGVQIQDVVNKALAGSSWDITDVATTLSDGVIGVKNLLGTLRTVFENITPQSFIVVTKSGIRQIFESRGFTLSGFTFSGFTRLHGVRILDEGLTATSSHIGNMIDPITNLSDAIGARFVTHIRSILETVTTSDGVDRLQVMLRTIVEASGFTETGFTLSGFFINNKSGIFDAITGTRQVLSSVIDNSNTTLFDLVEISEFDKVLVDMFETVTQSDVSNRMLGMIRNIYEVRGFTLSGFTFSGFVQLGVGIFDNVIGRSSIDSFRNIIESSGFSLSGFTLSGFTHGGGVFIGDMVSRMTTLNVVLSDTISLSGNLDRVISAIRDLTEPIINVSDLLVAPVSLFRSIFEQSGFTLTGFTGTGFVQDAGIYVFDSVVALRLDHTFFRNIIESAGFTITGFTASGFAMFGGVFINDFITKDVSKVISNTITSNDSVIRKLHQMQVFMEDSITVLDALIRKVDINRIISVTSGFTFTGFTLSGFTIDQGVIILDPINAMTRVGNFFREISEGSGLTRTGFTLTGFVIGGGVFISDNILPRFQAMVRYPSDVIATPSDAILGVKNLFGFLRPMIESITLTQNIRKDIVKNIIDSSGFTFAGFTLTGFTVSGGVLVQDIVERIFPTFGVIIDPAVTFGADITTGIKNILGNLRYITETAITQLDEVVRRAKIFRDAFEVPAFTSSGFTISGFLRTGVFVFDSVVARSPVDLFRNIIESAGFTLTGFTLSGFAISGGVFINDSIIINRALQRFTANTISLTDNLIKDMGIVISEISSLTDVVNRMNALERIIALTRGFELSGFTVSGFTQLETTALFDIVEFLEHTGAHFRNIVESSGFTLSGFTLSGFTMNGGIQILDSISKGVGKKISEVSLTLDDTLAGTGIGVIILESVITLIDGITKSVSINRFISEFKPWTSGFTLSGFTLGGVSIQDTIQSSTNLAEQFFREIYEGAGFTSSGFTWTGFVVNAGVPLIIDTITRVRDVAHTLPETIALSQSITKDITKSMSEIVIILNEEIIGSATDLLAGIKEYLTPVILSDVISKDVSKFISDEATVTLSDIITKDVVKFIIDPAIVLSDLVVQLRIVPVFLSETITLSDSILKDVSIFISDEVATILSDSIQKNINKMLSETMTLTQSIRKDVSKLIFDDFALTLGSRLVKFVSKFITDEAPVTLSDSISKDVLKNVFNTIILSQSITKDISKFIVDEAGVILSDSIQKDVVKFIIDTTTTLSDNIVKDVLKNIAEVITFSDVITKDVSLNISDEVGIILSDFIQKDVLKNAYEFMFLTDVIRRAQGVAVGPDFTPISDVVVDVATLLRPILDEATIVLSDAIGKDVTKILLNTITLSDSIQKDVVKFITESITLSDFITMGFGVTLIESITLSDSIQKDVVKFLTETITLVDDTAKDITKTLLETITLSDFITMGFGVTLLETITLSDNIVKDVVKFISETITVLDDTTKDVVKFIVDEAVIIVSDILTKDVTKSLSEVITLSDSIQKDVVKFLTETITLTDSITMGFGVTLSEIITLSDDTTKDVVKFITETIIVSDNIVKDVVKFITETIVLSDIISKGVGYSIIEPVITLSDDIQKAVVKFISEVITVTDSLTKDITKSLLETINLSDVVTGIRVVLRPILDEAAIIVSDILTKDVTKSLSEVITLSDEIQKDIVKFIIDPVIALSDSIATNLGFFLSESISLSDVINIDRGFFIIEPVITLSDSIQKDVVKFLTESTLIFDTIIKDVTKSLIETITISDNIQINVSKFISDIIILSDNIVMGFGTTILEPTISLVDSITMGFGVNILENAITLDDAGVIKDVHKMLFEVAVLLDQLVGRKNDIQRNFDEFVVLSDAITKDIEKFLTTQVIVLSDVITKNVNKMLTETITLTDSIATEIGVFINETIVIIDDITKDITKSITDPAIILSDIITKDITKTLLETITLSDNIVMGVGFFLNEVITITDNITKDITKTLLESITLSDDTTKDVVKFLTETITVTDLYVGVRVVLRPILDEAGIILSDAITKDITKALSESIAISDNIIKDITKSLLETITLSDFIVKDVVKFIIETAVVLSDSIQKDVVKVLSETITLSDAITKDITKTLVESITLSDSIVMGIGVFINETITLLDSISIDRGFFINEVITLSDSIQKDVVKFITESAITLSDSITMGFGVTIIEPVITLADDIQKDIVKFITDSITLVDNITMGIGVTITESITLSDFITMGFGSTMNEIITLSDNIIMGVSRTIIEVITLSDNIVMGIGVTLTEIVTLSDSIIMGVSRTILEAITVTDDVLKDIVKFITEIISVVDDTTKDVSKFLTETIPNIGDVMRFSQVRDVIGVAIVITDNIEKDVSKFILDSTVNFTEVVNIGVSKFMLDNTFMIDSIRKDISKFISDEVAIVLSDSILKNVEKMLSESIATFDIIVTDQFRFLTELIILEDTVRKIEEKLLLEFITITDSISKDVTKSLIEIVTQLDEVIRILIRSTVLIFRTIIKTDLVLETQIKDTMIFGSIIKQAIDFNTIVKQNIIFNTIVQTGLNFIDFPTLIQQSIEFNTIVRQAIIFNTIVKQMIIFNTIIKQNMIFLALIKDVLEYTTNIKISLNVTSNIGKGD